MWCSCCRKNVTGAISGQHDSICCSRCGTPLPGELPAALGSSSATSQSEPTPLPCPGNAAAAADQQAAEPCSGSDASVASESDASPAALPEGATVHAPHALRQPWLALESWEIDEDLRHMQRMLRGRRYVDSPLAGTELRIDAASTNASSSPSPEHDGLLAGLCAGLARMLLLLGLTTLVCGVSLLAWWHFGARPDLCAPGLGCTIVGQFLLMIGLAMQPERRKESAAADSKPEAARFDHALLYADLSAELEHPQSRNT
jgi:hypothetical protein